VLPVAPAIRKEAIKRRAKGGPGLREETAGVRKKRKNQLNIGHLKQGNAPHFFCAVRGKEADLESPSVRHIRVPSNRPALFQEHLSEVRDADGQQLCLLFLGSKENKIDEAFDHSRRQVGNIDLLPPLNVLLNQVIDFTMQAGLR
jgi:hypothetical protein